jgi:Mycothiol maleylpyruvate isomerase N-terminal domain
MIVAITEENWTATRKYLQETADRFAGLLTAVPGSGKATRHWTVAQTAAHVATLSRICEFLISGDAQPPPFRGVEELVRSTIVDTVDRFNETLLGQFSERDPRRLADLVRSDIDGILRASQDVDPATAVPWLGGSRVPLAGVLAHMLNELQIHGRDIARAGRAPWPVPAEEAAPFFELFLVGVTHYGYGRLLDGHGPIPKGRIAVEFRSGYTAPRTMVLTDGFVTVEKPGGATDVRLTFDPTSLNLMLFGRVGKPRAVLTRKVVIGGPRPWRLPAFLRIVRLPS